MAGIYIHIPFCKSRCIYCGFYSTTHHEMRQRYVDAVCHEWQKYKESLKESVDTIYIGGGTPSQLEVPQLRQLLDVLPKSAKEITIECNPDDITEEYADALSGLPVNRVSMGAQTFDDERLRFLHRRHTSKQVPEAVRLLRSAGIRNISVDLMFGFPNETIEDWTKDIEAALMLDVEHISAYCLMIEEGTALYDMGLEAANEEVERQMYEVLIEKLTAAGYEHYEISNFARPRYRSQHNSSYWNGTTYIGLGAAAHSYDGKERRWNISDVKEYCRRIEKGLSVVEEREIIDEDTHFNDRVMTGLRTREGIDLATLPFREQLLSDAKVHLENGLLAITDNRLHLTRKGLFVSDMVMSDLMRV